MKYFELENRMGADQCNQVTKEFTNKSITDYNLYNMYFTSECKSDNEKMYEFMYSNPNLRFKDGYGYTNGCVVEADSALRNQAQMTNERVKNQLCVRWNKAVPDLGKGGLIPNVESVLKNSEDTSALRSCDKVSEKEFDRYIPLPGCLSNTIQNPKHIIMPFTRGGDITRNYVFSNDYLEKCGFAFNGQFYEKKGGAKQQQQQQQLGPQQVLARPVSTN